MSTTAVAPNPTVQAVAGLITDLRSKTPAYEKLIRDIDTRLTMPLPEATDPLSQPKLAVIWDRYREAISARKDNAVTQLNLVNRLITDLTNAESIETCGALLLVMQGQHPALQVKANECDDISLFLAKKIVALVPHLEQQLIP